MQTYETGGSTFLYNPDASGAVIIRSEGKEVVIPFPDLTEFMAEIVLRARIEALEAQSAEEILGLTAAGRCGHAE